MLQMEPGKRRSGGERHENWLQINEGLAWAGGTELPLSDLRTLVIEMMEESSNKQRGWKADWASTLFKQG